MIVEKKYTVEREIEEVKAIILDLIKFGAYHPLIKKVIFEEATSSYKIIEQPFSWIPISFSYTAIVKEENDALLYLIDDIPFIKALIQFELSEAEDEGTTIKVKINLTGPSLITKLVGAKMFEAQRQLWDKVQEYT